jgi:hypothetical protein
MDDAAMLALVLMIQEKIDVKFGDHKAFLEEYKNKEGFTLYNEMEKICKPELTELYYSKSEYIRFIMQTIRGMEYKIFLCEKMTFVDEIWDDFMKRRFPRAILTFEERYGVPFKNYAQNSLKEACIDYIRKWNSRHRFVEVGVENVLDWFSDERNDDSVDIKYIVSDIMKKYCGIINTINPKRRSYNLLDKILVYHCKIIVSEKEQASCIDLLKEVQHKPLEIAAGRIEKKYHTLYGIDDSTRLFENLISRIRTEGEGRLFLDDVDLGDEDNRTKINEWNRQIKKILNNTKNKEKMRELKREYFDIINNTDNGNIRG